MASYESIYPGTRSSMEFDYGNSVGYSLSAGQVGAPLKPDSAAQLLEASKMLNQGIKMIEVEALSPEVFDQIPRQHFKEIHQLLKLTGAEPSLHAPVIEPSGIEGQQMIWDETSQMTAKQHFKDVIDKAHELDPDHQIPVTFHSANMSGSTFIPGDVSKGEDRYKLQQIIAINQETNRIENVFKPEERYRLASMRQKDLESKESAIKHKYSPEDMLEIANSTQWSHKVENLANNSKIGGEVIAESITAVANNVLGEEARRFPANELPQHFPQNAKINEESFSKLKTAEVFLGNMEKSVQSMFEEAWKYSDKESKGDLKKVADKWKSEMINFNNLTKEKGYDKNPLTLNTEYLLFKKRLIDNTLVGLNHLRGPEIFKPIEKFAMEKSADTFSDVALHSYKEYGSNAPIVSIENLYPGMPYSNPKDFQKLIKKTRDEFVKKAVKDGMSESEALRASKQVIGVTWDVGHLNMHKKYGFKDEDLAAATKLIAKDVKHVHLTDNFGYSDSHLPPGMGNVPFKKHLEMLEKQGVDLKKMKFINEAGGFAQHFGVSPHPYTLEAFGSPIYAMKMAPFWNQAVGTFGGYLAGYGDTNPSIHHTIYGAGFSALPLELGGQVPGTQSRFAGTPNA